MINERRANLTAKIPINISRALKNYTVDTKGSQMKQSEVVTEALELFLKEKGYLTNTVPA
jgi:hypothetical protein